MTLSIQSVMEQDAFPDQPMSIHYTAGCRLRNNIDCLMLKGYAPSTPAVLIKDVTTNHRHVFTETLEALRQQAQGIHSEIPCLLIAGDIASLHAPISCVAENGLHGLHILVARARPGVSSIAKHLRALGASVIEAPSISTTSLGKSPAVDAVLARLPQFDAVVFGCADGVHSVLKHSKAVNMRNVIAIGDQAKEALEKAGITPALATTGSCRNMLQQHRAVFAGKRLLLVTSNEGRPNLFKELSTLSARVETVAAYRVLHDFEMLERPGKTIDLLVLPSSSAAKRLFANKTGSALKQLPMVAMGPETEATARLSGAHHVLRSAHDDIESIVSRVLEQFMSAHTLDAELQAHKQHSLLEAGR